MNNLLGLQYPADDEDEEDEDDDAGETLLEAVTEEDDDNVAVVGPLSASPGLGEIIDGNEDGSALAEPPAVIFDPSVVSPVPKGGADDAYREGPHDDWSSPLKSAMPSPQKPVQGDVEVVAATAGQEQPPSNFVAAGEAVIPAVPAEPCSPTLCKKVADILQTEVRTGQKMLDVMRSNREYRNPNFMEKIVEGFGIDQYGTCFSPEHFDPHGLPPEDYLQSVRRKMKDKQRLERSRPRDQLPRVPLETQRKHPASAPASAAVGLMAAAGMKRRKWDA